MSDQESINILNSLIPPLNINLNPIQTSSSTNSESTGVQKIINCQNLNGQSSHEESPRPPMPGGVVTGGCPFFSGGKSGAVVRKPVARNPEWQTSQSVAGEDVPYFDYLKLDKILDAQFPISKKYGNMIHDEHLFIIVHQTYELWFKQIIFELDSIAILLGKPVVDERCLLVIVQRIQRINMIMKLLTDQIAILESMAPTDFIDFRGYLTTASGFQSLQFRLFENKLGLTDWLRFKFNQQKYDYVFTDDESRDALRKSLEEPSLLKLIEAWLERTPGLTKFDYDSASGNKI